MATLFDCNGVVIGESAGGSALVIWSEDSDMQSPEQVRELALVLMRWASEHGAPLIWANLPAELHEDAKKAGLDLLGELSLRQSPVCRPCWEDAGKPSAYLHPTTKPEWCSACGALKPRDQIVWVKRK